MDMSFVVRYTALVIFGGAVTIEAITFFTVAGFPMKAVRVEFDVEARKALVVAFAVVVLALDCSCM